MTTETKSEWKVEFRISAPLVGTYVHADPNLWPDVRLAKFEVNDRGESRLVEERVYRGRDSQVAR